MSEIDLEGIGQLNKEQLYELTERAKVLLDKKIKMSKAEKSEIDLEGVINHEEALGLAHLNKGGSNLSRCYIALCDEVERLRARVKELDGKEKYLMALCERLANGIAHMDSCMKCGDGTNRDCVYGGQDANEAVMDYNKLIPELNCHGMPDEPAKGDNQP